MKSAHLRNIQYAISDQREHLREEKEQGIEHVPFNRDQEEPSTLRKIFGGSSERDTEPIAQKTFGRPLTLEEFNKAEEAIGQAAVKGGKAVVKGGKAVTAYLKPIIIGKPLTEAEKRRQKEIHDAYEDAKHRERILRAREAGRASVRTPIEEPSLRNLGRSSLQAERYEAGRKQPVRAAYPQNVKTQFRVEKPQVQQPVSRDPVNDRSSDFLVSLGGNPELSVSIKRGRASDPTGASLYY